MRKYFLIIVTIILILGLAGCIKDPPIPDEGVEPKNPFVMNSYFSDSMIIQQNQPINIFGKSEKGVLIEVSLFKKEASEPIQSAKTFVDENGDWKVVFSPISASFQLYKLKVTDSVHTKEINDILVGEVWLTSGEKNMAWPMRYTKDASSYIINNENTKYIRYFSQDHYPNNDPSQQPIGDPQFDFSNGRWNSANSLKSFDASAISYIFACELFEELNKGSAKVPVGFIESAVAESNIHAWLPKSKIDSNPYLRNYLLTKNLYQIDNLGDKNYNQTANLYNNKINPLKGINLKGVIWYQGLSDIGYYEYYNEALRSLIDAWREELSPNLAFIVVGEHAYEKENLAGFRRAQILGTNYHLNVLIVPTYDLEFEYEYQNGYEMEKPDVSSPYYPINKIELAQRIEKAALSLVYNSNEKYFSPRLHNYTVSLTENTITLYFANTKNLRVKLLGEIEELAKPRPVEEYQMITNLILVLVDDTEIEAEVTVNENIIKIYYEDIKQIKSVKYAYLDLCADSNLFNEMDLPVLPFYLNIKWYHN